MTELKDIEVMTYKLETGYIFTIYIEKYDDYGRYSIVAADDYSTYEGGIFIEKFAESYEEAQQIAKKLAAKITAKN